MKCRSPRQCRERYQLFLSDQVRKNAKWTLEEDEILLSKYHFFGPHWKKLEPFFVGRTSYNIKNRFTFLSRRMKQYDNKEEHQQYNSKEKANQSKSKTNEQGAPQKTDQIFNNEYSLLLSESNYEFDLENFPLIIDDIQIDIIIVLYQFFFFFFFFFTDHAFSCRKLLFYLIFHLDVKEFIANCFMKIIIY